jgi:hypothetical protein
LGLPILFSPNTSPTAPTQAASRLLLVTFSPREPRPYEARIWMRLSTPCGDVDTTIVLRGIGFSSALGLPFRFSPLQFTAAGDFTTTLDTFRLTTCGRVTVPIYAARNLPDTLNVRLRLGFDARAVRVESVSSTYGTVTQTPVAGGVQLALERMKPDSSRPIMLVTFASVTPDRAAFPVTLDSIRLTRPTGDRFTLVAAEGFARVIVQKPELTALRGTGVGTGVGTGIVFDSVQVLDCRTVVWEVQNTGDVPLSGLSLVGSPLSGNAATVRVMSAEPPMLDERGGAIAGAAALAVGARLRITLQYCPRRPARVDTVLRLTSAASSMMPASELSCGVQTTASLRLVSFAAPLPLVVSFTPQFIPQSSSILASTPLAIENVRGKIGDTVSIPLVVNRNVATDFRGVTYWLRQFSFAADVRFNPYALRLLGVRAGFASSAVLPAPSLTQSTIQTSNAQSTNPLAPPESRFTLSFAAMDSLRAGTVAVMRFLVLVPDTPQTRLSVRAVGFVTDSTRLADSAGFLQVVNVLPRSPEAVFTTDSAFGLWYLPRTRPNALANALKTAKSVYLLNVSPNPASEVATVTFVAEEAAVVTLGLYAFSGERMAVLAERKQVGSGVHSIRIAVDAALRLVSGAYFLVLESETGGGTREREARGVMFVR